MIEEEVSLNGGHSIQQQILGPLEFQNVENAMASNAFNTLAESNAAEIALNQMEHAMDGDHNRVIP